MKKQVACILQFYKKKYIHSLSFKLQFLKIVSYGAGQRSATGCQWCNFNGPQKHSDII